MEYYKVPTKLCEISELLMFGHDLCTPTGPKYCRDLSAFKNEGRIKVYPEHSQRNEGLLLLRRNS